VVAQAVWSPDEKQLVSVGKDGLVAVWNWFAA
jgi:WD40 repeat protein